MSPWIAAAIAVFAWWFFTGAILLLVRRADAGDAVAHGRNVFLSVPLLAVGVAGVVVSSAELTVLNVYIAFLSTLLIWGWIELAFLSGVITGPERRPCPPGLTPGDRFFRAWQTVSYHELLLAFALLVLVTITRGAENTFAFWTYLILFVARISAKLNLFFGVPRTHVEFLPDALSHLSSHFRVAGMNWLFPISVTALTFATACWLERLYAAPTMGEITGFALLTALTALATLEHWVMVLPIPDERLWRWMLPAPQPEKHQKTQGGHHGL